MLKYGTDKPDLRNPLIIKDVTDIFQNIEFNAFKGKIVRTITVPNAMEIPRRFYDGMVDFAISECGAKGLAWLKVLEDGTLQGPLQAELLNLISLLNLQERVILLGFDANPYKYMSKCKFFVCASSYEGFSNVLIEALVCECAVLCTEHKSGAKELFGDNEYGLLVAVNDEDALFEGLQTMCEDKHLRQEYEKKANKRAKDFDKTKIARELFEILGE